MQIQFTEKQAKALKRLTSSRHLPMAELVRQDVDAVLRSTIALDDEEKRKRAPSVAGWFRSGKRDVSRQHDKHLAETFGE